LLHTFGEITLKIKPIRLITSAHWESIGCKANHGQFILNWFLPLTELTGFRMVIDITTSL